ncbi:uncharacterized protein A1O5_11181 [Cladophialophora psammophila CBS 110553]|uniref:Uncharacterized protein n=1 Tax=Cladophialophora psammophila CBS 110553 TaxID=1182543 RepID=W9X5C1_9EURO|nr:uncharacterized protein A1O5_11181 [Cladophialophora psammophila CBS 110553]EXJ65654.1 hypothetical protein A1O5_11181 [Cladophialophora psammophila CBS 110553]
MPLVYREGIKAFSRLQEEILKKATDLSLEFRKSGNITLIEDQYRFRDEISLTNHGVKINTAVQFYSDGIYILDLCRYSQYRGGPEPSVGIYLKRVVDPYFRYWPDRVAQSRVPPLGRLALPIYLASTLGQDGLHAILRNDSYQRIGIGFPKDSAKLRVEEIRAAQETYWNANERYFSIHGLVRFHCLVRFRIVSRLYGGAPRGKDAMFILVCHVADRSSLRLGLYTENSLQITPKGFIDPFKNIEQYGPLGDPFSLSVLMPPPQEGRSAEMVHGDLAHDYVVTACLAASPSPLFLVTITLRSQMIYP